ncbi:hypothetical protein ACFSC3_19795 [Sphingomonas floccifaciens]|uniref:Bacterial surface antigen (D15) domain-containing protein n=1 Tax=Sphingomonas floccifaciens TaxID=1844115 RepID=A0ABW4NKF1_9SPHN
MTRGNGRALRFVGVVTGGWIAIRVVMLWPQDGTAADVVRDVMPVPVPVAAKAEPRITYQARGAESVRWTARSDLARVGTAPRPRTVAAEPNSPPATSPSLAAPPVEPEPVSASSQTAVAGPLAPLPPERSRKRLSVSGWLIARSGASGDAGLLAPQLGGTQGGVRVDYHLAHGIAATARFAASAAGVGREVSIGLAWRRKGVPIRLVAEQRIALDGARGGPSVGISGGVDTLPLPAGFQLDAYGQAGTIFRGPAEHFIDGSARATHGVGAIGRVTLDAGIGTWGAAQRGAARLDVGPSIGARIPIGGTRLRLVIDWRQRIAGRARPGSGPALTLGTDF